MAVPDRHGTLSCFAFVIQSGGACLLFALYALLSDTAFGATLPRVAVGYSGVIGGFGVLAGLLSLGRPHTPWRPGLPRCGPYNRPGGQFGVPLNLVTAIVVLGLYWVVG